MSPMPSLIPAVDPAPLPAPAWLFHLLWIVTFTLHLLLVNGVLGGSILNVLALARPRFERRAEVLSFFLKVNTWGISFAITLGIAPLLFMQVLYGRFFYTATILVAWGWLALLGMLTLAYYLNYLSKYRLARGHLPVGCVTLQAILFLIIAGIQVVVHLLHVQPNRWPAVADNAWAALADPTFVPRFLHFVLAAVAIAGGALAWWRVRDRKAAASGPLPSEARFGITAALVATAVQLPIGFWMLFALPRDVMLGFMRAGPGVMAPFGVGILTGVAAIVILALCLSPMAQARLVRRAAEVMVLTMVLMVLTRHQLRDVYLAVAREAERMEVAPQWGVFALFVLLFLISVGLTAFALVRAARDRPAPGEPAA